MKKNKTTAFAAGLAAALLLPVTAVQADTLSEVLAPLFNTEQLIYTVLSAVGSIVLAWNVAQLALSLKSHDPSSRQNALMGMVTGIVLILIKPLVTFIKG